MSNLNRGWELHRRLLLRGRGTLNPPRTCGHQGWGFHHAQHDLGLKEGFGQLGILHQDLPRLQ